MITKCNSETVSRVPYKMARHNLGMRVDGNIQMRFSMIVVESKVPSRWGSGSKCQWVEVSEGDCRNTGVG